MEKNDEAGHGTYRAKTLAQTFTLLEAQMPRMYNCWKDDYSIDFHQNRNENISYRFYTYYRSYYRFNQTTAYNGAEWLVRLQADHRQKGSEAVGHGGWLWGEGEGEIIHVFCFGFHIFNYYIENLSNLRNKMSERVIARFWYRLFGLLWSRSLVIVVFLQRLTNQTLLNSKTSKVTDVSWCPNTSIDAESWH